MNYGWHYWRLIERARGRVLDGYKERHHVTPRCMGGSDEPGNIVDLSAEEHFVAHQLLVKMYPAEYRLVLALSAMTATSSKLQRSNKRYGWLRRRFAEAKSTAMMGVKRGPISEDTRAKMSAASKGRKKSPEHVASIRAVKARLKGTTLPPRSEEWKLNHASAMRRIAKTVDRSFTQTAEYKSRQSENSRRIWAERKAQVLAKERLQLPRM